MNALELLIFRCAQVAVRNNDEFAYKITVEPLRGHRGWRYTFEAIETADHHVVISGTGDSMDAMVANTNLNFKAAIDCWGYTE